MKILLASMLITLIPLASAGAGEQFACNMKALTSGERARHQELTRTLLTAIKEKSELADGYAFRLLPENLMVAAEWVSFERKCCPFFTFEMEQGRDSGPLWIRIKGPEGVKTFIRAEFPI